MASLVTYRLDDTVASITLDDGKVNVLSLAMLTEINAALDRAQADRAVVFISGRPGVFSAGFDLAALRSGGSEAMAMVRAGFELSERMLSFPTPVVVACTGHAIAMGTFLLLSGNYRVGAVGSYKFTANEVAIGLTMPRAAVEILRQRLSPASFNRAAILAEVFSPDTAVSAGFLDRVVEHTEVDEVAKAGACSLATLDMDAHLATKPRARGSMLDALRRGIEADYAAFRRPVFS